MTIDAFWNIVDRVHTASGGDMDAKCKLLAQELHRLSSDEVAAFDAHFSNCQYQAYSWDLWGAAYLINGGCGDDSFMDFRATLISLGQTTFEVALANADSLANSSMDPAWATYEGYQYMACQVYAAMGGRKTGAGRKHPQEVAGTPFEEWKMEARYPKLTAKFGYHDADYLDLKEEQDKAAETSHHADQLARLLLETGLVQPCGLIPPLRTVAQVVRSGKSPAAISPLVNWKPFELDEPIFWLAVTRLESSQLDLPKTRPDLQGVKLALDVRAGEITDFDDWLITLKNRGLA